MNRRGSDMRFYVKEEDLKKESKMKTKEVEVVNPQVELAKYEPRYNNLTTQGSTLKVVDEPSKIVALTVIRELEELQEKYKAFRDSLVSETIKKMQKLVMERERTIKGIVGDYKSGLRGSLGMYETQQAEIRRKEEEKLRAEQQKKYEKEIAKADKRGSVPPPPPPPVSVVAKKEEGVSYSDKPIVEVIDFKLVPDECKVLNEKVAIARAKLGVKDPGLRVTWIKTARIGDSKVEEL